VASLLFLCVVQLYFLSWYQSHGVATVVIHCDLCASLSEKKGRQPTYSCADDQLTKVCVEKLVYNS
jgi:hypothetical protein